MMNRFLKGRRAAPWAWMQTGPLTVDAERLAAVAAERIPPNDQSLAAVAAERIPASTHTPACTEGALLPKRVAEATPEVSETEDTKLTLDDFPALKAAMESFEKRGDPILISIDPEPSAEGALPKPAPERRAKANPRKSRSKRIAKSRKSSSRRSEKTISPKNPN